MNIGGEPYISWQNATMVLLRLGVCRSNIDRLSLFVSSNLESGQAY